MTEFIARSGVSITFMAYHVDPIGNEGRHRHTWKITVERETTEPLTDGRDLRPQLRCLMKLLAPYSAKTRAHEFPAQLWSGEAICRALMERWPGCVKATVERAEFVASLERVR